MTPEYKQAMEDKRERFRRLIPFDIKHSVTDGVNHVAVYCRDIEATARFYTEVMGMPVINVIDNRDVPESTHMNIDVGNGMAFSFFDFPHIPRLQEFATKGVGNVMHIALPITPARYAEGKAGSEMVGGSLYVKDPNRLGIELLPTE